MLVLVIKYILWARECGTYVIYLILFFQQPYKVGNISPFYKWDN